MIRVKPFLSKSFRFSFHCNPLIVLQGMEMADAAAIIPRGSFEWHVFNPFRSLEATFCHESPDVKLWKVTLESVDRQINYRCFSVYLEFLDWFDRRREIVAESILIFMNLDGTEIAKREIHNYFFCADNMFRFYFEGSTEVCPRIESHHLVIRIELSLHGRTKGNELENGIANKHGLKCLSRDLGGLLAFPKYSNVILLSGDDNPIKYFIHSYIIGARCSKFFEKHPLSKKEFQSGNDLQEVKTNISSVLLLDILSYIYSGIMGINLPHWKDPRYVAEMFQVIERYELNDLYKAFTKNDMQHLRMTRNSAIHETRLFPLDVISRPPSNTSQTWHVICKNDLQTEYEIIFQIRVWNKAGNWLSYSLQSKSPSRVYVEVNLELVKRVEGNDSEPVLPFHEKEYAIDLDANVESGPILFLGCPETFGKFFTTSDRTNTEYFLRCFLNISNGTRVEKIQCENDDALPYNLENLDDLCYHMNKLRKREMKMGKLREQEMKTDLQVLGRGGFLDGNQLLEHIHKGIVAARAPSWMESGTFGEGTATLSSEILPIVLDFIYTGNSNEIFSLPSYSVKEAANFAKNTEFHALDDIVIGLFGLEFDK